MLQFKPHLPFRSQGKGELIQRAIVKQGALVNQQHPGAEGRDVSHVVACEQHRCTGAAVVIRQELPHPRLGIHIQPQRGLIEEQHLGLMQQGRQQFSLHPLAEGELSHGPSELLTEFEQIGQCVDPPLSELITDSIDRRIHPQRIHRR